MNITGVTLMNAGKRWWRVLLALLLWGAAAGQAGAAIVVNAIAVSPTTQVAPGATITVTVSVTLSNNSRWRSTSFSTTPAGPSLSFCSLAPDLIGNTTHVVSFSMKAPDNPNVFALNVAAWANPNCNGVVSPTKTLPNAINTNPVVAGLNHVRIQHDGSGLTCSPESITLKACANADCSKAFTDAVSVSLGAGGGAWSANPVTTFSNGIASVTLSNAISGEVSLSGAVTSPSATNSTAICYNGNTANACKLTFSTGSCFLDAVEPGKAANTPIYTKLSSSAFTLDVLALKDGVIDTASKAKIDATLVRADADGNCSSDPVSAPVSITLANINAGRATLTFTPTTAARVVRVKLVSGSLNGCSSDKFAIRPAGLALTVSGIASFAAGTDASAGTGLKAGSASFSMNAAAGTGYDGAPVVNPNRVQASGAKNGIVGGAFNPASQATGWAASGSAFTYSEVGYFKLLPYAVYDETFADIDEGKSPKDCFNDTNFAGNGTIANPNLVNAAGMFGCYFGSAAETNYFGRFIPARLVLSGASLTNRSAITGCAAEMSFSYMGEEMAPSFMLTAQNSAGATTENYEGTFARLNLATQLGLGAIDAPATGVRTPFALCGASAAHPCVTAGATAGVFEKGVANLTLPLTVFRGAAAAGPYDSFKVGVAPQDSDLVKLDSYNLDTSNAGTDNRALVGSTLVRYGRMQIENAYGAELLHLTMKLNAQFWNRTAYATNTLDNCTDPLFMPFVLSDYSANGGLNPDNMPDARKGPVATLVNGGGKLVLGKPISVPTKKGSVTVRSAFPWLPGNGRATFGVYKSGPVIHVREIY